MIADYLLLITVLIMLLNIMLTMIFCRVMKKKTVIKNTLDVKKSDTRPGTLKSSLNGELFSYLYGLARYNAIVIGKFPSHRIRKLFYKYVFCMNLDKQTVIYGGCEIRSPWNITIGKSTIGVACILDGRYGIEIRDSVCLGGGVHIWTAQHDVQDPNFSTVGKCEKVILEEYVWLASNSTILPGIIAHEGSVLASGGIATKDMETYTIYGGIPAEKIGIRNLDLHYKCGNVVGYWHFY